MGILISWRLILLEGFRVKKKVIFSWVLKNDYKFVGWELELAFTVNDISGSEDRMSDDNLTGNSDHIQE